ncbi:MAG: hypothetical protein V1708_06580 [Candidatus Micrarchaeota archaeon]
MQTEKGDKMVGAYIAAIIILAGASSFVYFRYIAAHATDANGLTLYARFPAEELRTAISTGKVIIREELFAGGDDRNTVVGVVGAEISGAYSRNNRVTYVYGHIDGAQNEDAWVNCLNETDYCAHERIIVRIDPCNCLRIEGGKLYVLFDEETAKNAATRTALSGIINGVLRSVDSEKTGVNAS